MPFHSHYGVDVISGFDQDVLADVLARDVDGRRAGRLEDPQRPVALGDRLAAEHDADVSVQRLDRGGRG